MNEQETAIKKDLLTEEAFARLLKWLDPDLDKAALKYEQIRLRLIRFFQFNDCPYSEDCADDIFQRVTRKLSEGVEIKVSDPFTYFRGVARNVLLEYWRSGRQKDVTLDDISPSARPIINPKDTEQEEAMRQQKERAMECLPECLAKLSDDNREIFLRYHQPSNQTNIEARAELARELKIEINALRNRITRTRDKLEQCLRECIAQKKITEKVGKISNMFFIICNW